MWLPLCYFNTWFWGLEAPHISRDVWERLVRVCVQLIGQSGHMIHYVFVSLLWEGFLQRLEPSTTSFFMWFPLSALIVFHDEKLVYNLLSSLCADKID